MGTWIETAFHDSNPAFVHWSFPSWERGLKLLDKLEQMDRETVVPLVGTWIETTQALSITTPSRVVPLVGTWIETAGQIRTCCPTAVVPLVGTWIETINLFPLLYVCIVVPLVGTWIETSFRTASCIA